MIADYAREQLTTIRRVRRNARSRGDDRRETRELIEHVNAEWLQ